MKKVIVSTAAAAFACASLSVFAMDDMAMMDTNHDGMVSKSEYMKYHETMWSKMKKKNGMVDMKDMGMGKDGMAKDGMAKDGMAKDGMAKGDTGMMKSDKGGMMKEKGK